MKGSEHADAVLDRVLARRPWIVDDSKAAGRGRYARIYEYRKNISLQVLHTPSKGKGSEALEVGLVFDDPSRSANTSNLEDYREQLGTNETKLGLTQRDGDKAVYYYLTRIISLTPDPSRAYEEATDLCVNILDLVLGGPQVRKLYRSGRDKYEKEHRPGV
jgi:hypothetical protein